VVSLYDFTGDVKIKLLLDTQNGTIKGDSNMLRQVLHNLLQNAQDALADKIAPVITVKTQSNPDMLVLTVQDNGAGFPAEMMPHVFEPYMTTKPHGTGLGLAIVKKIIEEHKGNIKIENGAKSGAIITISIPLMVESRKNEHLFLKA